MWRQLIFLHIPKTAGWALHAALQPIFGEAQSLRVNDGNDLERLRALSPRDFSRYRYVSGHFTYNDVKPKCRDDALFVSILRDPVRRLISEFNYIASWADHPHHEHFKDLRFSNHVAANAAFIRGLQCDWLSGHRDAERAMAVIRQNYALVGTVEKYSAFIAALGQLIGHDIPTARSNVTQGQGLLDIDSRLCGLLLDLADEDRRLIDQVAALPGGVFTGGLTQTIDL
jgi:hypothetical protein